MNHVVARIVIAAIAFLPFADACMSADVSATQSGNPIAGLWQGSLGKEKVVVCFDDPKDGREGDSKYYYLRHGETIKLVQSGDGASNWGEYAHQDRSGMWALESPAGKTLRGTWSAPGGERRQPIQLTRLREVADPENDTGRSVDVCRNYQFYLPLARTQQLFAQAEQIIQGKRFRLIKSMATIKDEKNLYGPVYNSIELLEPGQKVDAINRKLHARYIGRLARHYGDVDGGLSEFFENVLEFTDDHLTLDEYQWTAGYGASGISRWTETWDMKTGQIIDRTYMDLRPDADGETTAPAQ